MVLPPPFSPSPPPPKSPSSASDDLALGLGLGLGIGIPLLIVCAYLLYVRFGRSKADGPRKLLPSLLPSLGPTRTNSSLTNLAGRLGAAAIPAATADVGVPQKGGDPGVYAVVSGNRWFWRASDAK